MNLNGSKSNVRPQRNFRCVWREPAPETSGQTKGSVRKFGERIMKGQKLNVLLGTPSLGDIHNRSHHHRLGVEFNLD